MSSHHHLHPTVPARPISRRNLFKALAASSIVVGAGAALGPTTAVGAPSTGLATSLAPTGGRNRLVPVNRIGIQLFTVGDKIRSLGFRAVFEELADIGYAEVEFAGYTQGNVGAITVQEIRRLLDDNGLRAVGAHTTINANSIDQEIENAQVLGMPAFGSGGPTQDTSQGDPRNSVAAWQRGAALWNQWGEKAVRAGLGPIYAHNHTAEFAPTADDPDRRVYDVLWEGYDPRYAEFQLDVYWAYAAQHLYPGFEPIDWVKRDPRRFSRLHLKDGKTNPQNSNGYDIVEFGDGDIPYAAFLAQLRDRGQRAGIFEQDTASRLPGPDGEINSLGAARRSYTQIAALRG